MSEVSKFKPLKSHQELIGPRIRGSKKRFDWEFDLEGRRYVVSLECSFLTNKRRVYVDNAKQYEGYKQFGEQFRYTLQSNKHMIVIENEGSSADLLVDNLSFKHEYTLRTLNVKPHSYYESNQKETRDLYLKKLWENTKIPEEAQNTKVGELLKDTDQAQIMGGLIDLDQPQLRNLKPAGYNIELKPISKPIPSDFLELDPSVQSSASQPSAPRLTNEYDFLDISDNPVFSSDLLNLDPVQSNYPSLPQDFSSAPNQDIFTSNLQLQQNSSDSSARRKQDNAFEVLFS